MAYPSFKKSVFLRLTGIGTYQARNVWEAFEYLDLHWPAARTDHYRRAKSLCRAAADGLVPPDVARRALVDAAQRAKLLATGWKLQPDLTKTVYRRINQECASPAGRAHSMGDLSRPL